MHQEPPDEVLQNLNVVIKITERCNLACDYCYFFFRGDNSHRSHPPLIRSGVVDDIGKFFSEGARRYGITKIKVALHGGEPLLLRKEAFC